MNRPPSRRTSFARSAFARAAARFLASAAVGCALSLAALSACSGPTGPKKQLLKQACEKGRDCAYGLECREKTCQYIVFGDCEGDGINPASGQPTCLNGQRCKDNHCVVQCAAPNDCKEGETCRIGLCAKGSRDMRQCYDNRDCIYPETCYYGQCVTRTDAFRCNSDLDCGVGFRCINGRCT